MSKNKTGFLERLKGTLGTLQQLFGADTRTSPRRGTRLGPLQELEDRRLLSAAPIGPEFKVNTTTSNTQQTTANTPKSIAVAPSGDSIAVWASKDQDGNGWGVYAQRFDAAGAKQGAEFRVNTTTSNDQLNPAVAVDSSGNFAITWSSKQSGNWDVYAQLYAANGTALGSEFRVNTVTANDQQDASIAMDASGNFVITWASNNQDGNNWGVYAQRYNAAGVAQGTEFQVNTYTSDAQYDPQAAMDASGNFVISWTSHNQDGNNDGIYAQRFDAAGVQQGAEFRVNTYTDKEQQYSDVAMDPNGNFVITWSSHDQDGNGYGVYAQRYDASGASLGAEFQVNANTDKDQRFSSAAIDANGNFVITWSSKGQEATGDTWGIYAQRYLASGTADGAEFRVNTTINNDQEFSSVGMAPSGNFIILWSGNGPGDGAGVFAQRYQVAGISVTPTSGLVTSEDGTTATFSVVLTTQPTANVTITLTSSDASEGTSSVGSLVFTSANWNVARIVTVTGVNDGLVDGAIAYSIVTGPAVSTDPAYNNLNASDVALTNVDNESAGFVIGPMSGLVTTEAGGTAVVKIALTTAPTANVTIGISSSNPAEGTVSVSSLTFTPANWGTGQGVTITGVDDASADGDVAYTIITAPAVSADPSYNGLDASDVTVVNADNDMAGINVTPTSGLVTTEAGGQANFSVVLNSQPTADVTITLTSSSPVEGTVSTSSLTFTSANWNVAQIVTITGADDLVADGDVAYTIVIDAAASADPGYDGLDPSDVSVVNQDNDVAGINVSGISGPTTEAGGTATFTVVLTSQPTANVTVGLSSSNTAEGTVGPASLTFTSANWNTAQTVTVTGGDDFVDDGTIAYTIVTAPAVGGDANYTGLDATDVAVVNQDNDAAGINVTPISGPTTEAGGTATFTVNLNSQPTADVTIGISSSNPGEGTLSTASLTFTAANWNVAQIVTVTGVDDFVDDGDIGYSIVTAPAVSADAGYNGTDAADVTVVNQDNDAAGINVSAISGPTTEAGGTATFTVNLTSQPTADVTIGISSSNPGEGTLSTASLTFTAANWNVAQTVTVTGGDDLLMDGNVGYNIVTAPAVSGDANYSGLDATDVAVVNQDNDTAGIIISPISGQTTEAGGTATFTVSLNSQPTADVTIGISSSVPGEGTPSTASLTFTAANWNVAQTVTVTGGDDLIMDGNVGYNIVTAPAVSGDANYTGLDATDVAVVNQDNDTAGINVSPITGPTTEAGATATFTVNLTSQPTADVTIGISSSVPGEGTPSTASLTFTAANWNVAQTVTVTGGDDLIMDGNVGYNIVTAPAVSGDANYSGLDATDVAVVNQDNDTAGINVTPISGPTTEAGATATFTVNLNSQPTADVTIGISSSVPGEGTPSTASLTFTAANWNVAQTVTVTGGDDLIMDGNVGYNIVTAPAVSGDANYSGLDATDVAVVNQDNDTAGINVTPISGPTTEAGATATFTVNLNSQPTADVTIGISSSNPGEGTLSTASLTFTAANWNVAQTVTVTGVDDFVDDGNAGYSIVTAPAVSADPTYNNLNANDVAVTNLDNDVAGINVSAISGPTTEAGGTATFTVVLNSQPTANVTIGITSSNPAEGTPSTASLTFTAGNWNVAQTVTVTGVDDFVVDGDIAYTIVTAPAVSGDASYTGMDAADVSVTNLDNDVAGISVTPTSGLLTTEAGGSATFDVVLTSQPTANVTVGISSSNPSEGTPSTASLTFTAANWNVAQTVTVTGVDDFVADGNASYAIVTAPAVSGDAAYIGVDAADIVVVNQDNDTVGINVSVISGPTTEAGGAATFVVILNSQPTADVTIGISSFNAAEGIASTASLTYTGANWNVAQTVTVTGVEDFVVDGNVSYVIVTAAAFSSDPGYNGLGAADVSAVNQDDDVAGIDVAPTAGLVTTPGGSASFSVVLTSQPTASVTISLASSNPLAGDVTQSSLTFTAADWNTPQTVTVSSPGAPGIPGDVAYTIHVGPAVSADLTYNAQSGSDVAMTHHVAPVALPIPPAPPTLIGPVILMPVPAPFPNPTAPATGASGPGSVPSSTVTALLLSVSSASTRNANEAAETGTSALLAQAEIVANRTIQVFAPIPQSIWQPVQNFANVLPDEVLFHLPLSRLQLLSSTPSQGQTGQADDVLDVLSDDGERIPWTDAGLDTAAMVGTGILAGSGYVLLNSRLGLWLLGLVTAQPVWKQFDPLDVLYAWEEDEQNRSLDEEDEETLMSLVD